MAVNFMNFKTKHAVAGSSKLRATMGGAHIYNIKAGADVDNGTIVGKGALVAGTMDVYAEAAAPGTFRGKVLSQAANGNYYVEVTAADGALLLLNVPMIYEEYNSMCKHESNFYNAKDDIVRAYELCVGDIYEISLAGFAAKPTIGDDVKVNASSKKLEKAV